MDWMEIALSQDGVTPRRTNGSWLMLLISGMRELYFKDKNNNVAFRGFQPTTDINCPPLDYFRFGHALNYANLFQDLLRVKCPIPIPDDMVRKFVLQETDKMIEEKLANSSPNPAIHQLIIDKTLSHKEQNKLLKGVTLTITDILWLNKEAQDIGYLLDMYHEERYPEIFNAKKPPVLFHQKKDGTIEKMGATDMTEGGLRALLEQRKVIQARVYHKDKIWHCFYFTYKGLAGEEGGLMGSKPHYHYLSNKSGIAWDELIRRIKKCDMPSSKVHIIIER